MIAGLKRIMSGSDQILEGIEMKRSWNIARDMDWRSLVIGLLIGMVVLMSSGHETGQRFLGRYTAFSAGNSEDAIFIVDTYSGQTWRLDASGSIDYGIPESEMPKTDLPESNRLD